MTDRCVDGRLMRHKPFPDDPEFEHDMGECPECCGIGCERIERFGSVALAMPSYAADRYARGWSDAREAAATVALEQRCERGTPWDLACTTIAKVIRSLTAPAVEKPGKYPRIEARPFNDPPTPSKDADK